MQGPTRSRYSRPGSHSSRAPGVSRGGEPALRQWTRRTHSLLNRLSSQVRRHHAHNDAVSLGRIDQTEAAGDQPEGISYRLDLA